MILKLIPRLKTRNPKWKNGKVNDAGGGSITVQLAIEAVCGNMNDFIWEVSANENAILGTAKKVNIPMNIDNNNFETPHNGFKLKGTMHPGGLFTVHVIINGKIYSLPLTTEALIKNRKDPEKLAVSFDMNKAIVDPIPLTDPVIDDDNYEVEPYIEIGKVYIEKSWIGKKIEVINTFLNKNKWYFFAGCFILGFIVRWISQLKK